MDVTTFPLSPADALPRGRADFAPVRRPFQSLSPSPTEAAPPTTLWGLVREHAWRHRGALLLALLLNAIPGFGVALQTLAPKYLIDDVLAPAALSPQIRLGRLAALLAVYLVAALVFRMAAWYGSYKVWTAVREQITMELRAKFFRHINRLCLRFHGRHSSGELFTYVMGSPLGEISSFYHNIAMNVPNALTAFAFSVALIGLWDWTLTLVLLALVVSTVLAMNHGSARLQRLNEDFQRVESKIVGRLTDIFRGNRDVKMYAIEDRMSAAFEKNADTLRATACARDLKTHQVNMRQEAIGYFCFALVCCLGAWRFWEGRLTTGQLVGYLAAYGALQGPVGLVFSLGTQRGRARASFLRLMDLLTTASSTPDPKPHIAETPPDRADLTLRDVRFSYLADQPVLQDLNLTIPFGQRIAFVGPSGSGKSTLAKLLLRLYDPDGGSVALGGVDLRRCRSAEVRQKFGVVPQDPYFFSTTLRENLLVMRPDASEAELRHACELANAWEFIEKMPDRLDTAIGEGGARLSGGQRQRLAIARALLHEPQYMIFDEATSALDTVSEQLVQDALGRILSGGQRTAVFIAHRLSTIKNCDRVLVIDSGRVVQDGTFESLKNKPGLFRRMVASDRF